MFVIFLFVTTDLLTPQSFLPPHKVNLHHNAMEKCSAVFLLFLPGVLVDGAELLELPVADGDDVLGEQRHRRHVRRPDHVAALKGGGDHSYVTS